MTESESEFQRRADAVLDHLELSLENEGDLGVENHDGIVRIEFADRTRLIVNRHSAARQIWLAASDGAWHFSYDPTTGAWTDPRSGAHLHAELNRLIERQLGRSPGLRPPS